MPSSEKSVEVRKSFLAYLTMEKSFSTVAVPGKTVAKPPQKSRSTGKRPPVYDQPSVCLSVGLVTGIPKLIHYRVVLFHTPDSGLTDL